MRKGYAWLMPHLSTAMLLGGTIGLTFVFCVLLKHGMIASFVSFWIVILTGGPA